ncbi:MAG: glycosyltransferase family 4 protein [Cyanobacteria bacterium J06581_3]
MSNSRISLVHPTSNPNSRNAAQALAEASLLSAIITTTAYNPQGSISQFLKRFPRFVARPIIRELERRTWIAPQGVGIKIHPAREALRIALVKTQLSNQLGFGKQGPIDWVYTSLDQQVARHHLNGIDAIYAYEDGAASTFAAAKARGILCLYDLPIAFYQTAQAIQIQEAKRFPEYTPALQATREPAWKLERKAAEVKLADHIFVASSFTKQSLLSVGIDESAITVIPYGSPIDYFQPQSQLGDTFRALFVGRVGPRKGVHYLLQAWKSLNLTNAELLMVGVNEFPEHTVAINGANYRHIPSVSHYTLNQYYNSASVFVFPSLVEGFGLVLLEAMACGIPIITTPNTAGPDIITDGVEGFIIPIRDVAALKAKLEWCYQNPQAVAEMGKAARKKAEQLTWERYRSDLGTKVKELIESYHPSCVP